jgi:hypothetical protein
MEPCHLSSPALTREEDLAVSGQLRTKAPQFDNRLRTATRGRNGSRFGCWSLEKGTTDQRKLVVCCCCCCLDIQRGQRCMHSFALPNRDTTPPPCCMMQRLAPRLVPPRWRQDTTAIDRGWNNRRNDVRLFASGAALASLPGAVGCQIPSNRVDRPGSKSRNLFSGSGVAHSKHGFQGLRLGASLSQPQHECFNQRNETVYRTDKESRPTPRQCPPSFTATAPGH